MTDTNLRPDRKVTLGALAGAVTAITVGLLNTYLLDANPIPGEVGAGATTVVTFGLSYWVK